MKKLYVGALLALVFAIFLCGSAFAADKLVIRKLVFADEITGMGQYVPRAEPRFTLDDQCKIYVEAEGFSTPLTQGTKDEFNISVAVDVKVKLPQSGKKIGFQADMEKLETKLRSKLDAHFFAFGFSFEGWKPGNYALEVGVRDNLGGQTVSQDLVFQLVKPTEADIKARKEREAQQQAEEQSKKQPKEEAKPSDGQKVPR